MLCLDCLYQNTVALHGIAKTQKAASLCGAKLGYWVPKWCCRLWTMLSCSVLTKDALIQIIAKVSSHSMFGRTSGLSTRRLVIGCFGWDSTLPDYLLPQVLVECWLPQIGHFSGTGVPILPKYKSFAQQSKGQSGGVLQFAVACLLGTKHSSTTTTRKLYKNMR